MNTSISRCIIFIITAQLLAFLPKSYCVHISVETKLVQDSVISRTDSLKEVALGHHTWAAKNYKFQLDSAIIRADQALKIRKLLFSGKSNINLGKSYHNMGVFLKRKGDLSQAKDMFKEAVSVYSSLDQERVMRSLLELGKIYRLEGDYSSAIKYSTQVIELAIKNDNKRKIRDGVVDLGQALIKAKKDSLAIAHLQKYEPYFKSNNKNIAEIKGKYYNNLALAYLKSNRYDDAIKIHLKASGIDKSDFVTQASIYINLASLYRLKEDDEKCLEALQKGKDFAYKTNDAVIIAFSHRGLGKFYESNENVRKALTEYQTSLTTLLPSFSPKDDFENPNLHDFKSCVDKIDLLKYLNNKVDVLISMKDSTLTSSIIKLLKLGDKLIAEIRQEHFINDIKLHWRKEVFPFYETAIAFSYDQNLIDDAFYFFEKTKSVVLLEGYSFNASISQISLEHKRRYEEFKMNAEKSRKINSYNNLEDLVGAQRDFEMYTDTLSILYPSLFKKYKDQFLISLDSLQSQFIDSTSLFIHYFYGEDQVYALTIDSKTSNIQKLGSTTLIDSLIIEFSSFFAHSSNIENDLFAYQTYSNGIYLKLLKPILNNNYKNVVIIPDGKIGTLPMEALVSYVGTNAHDSRYVIDDMLIRYAFSGSIMNRSKDPDENSSYDLVAFIPYSSDSSYANLSFSGVERKMFDFNEGRALKVKFIEGKEADLSTLFGFKERLSVLHFSSHGLSDDNGVPSIVLSNSSISLTELYSINLPAELVFLSTCKSNLGREAFGEGIQSMARGFTYAGASSVVSSLWNVVAQPNSKIVRSFYENISKGIPKHKALHDAKRSYINDPSVPAFEKSPYYWGGLVYYGEDDIVHLSDETYFSSIFKILFYLVLALLFGVIFGRRLFKSK